MKKNTQINEIEKLKQENEILKKFVSSLPSYKKTGESAEHLLDDLLAKQKLFAGLNDFAKFLNKIQYDDNFLEKIGKKLHEISGTLAVSLSLYDKSTQEIVIRYFSASTSDLNTLEKTIGNKIIGMRIPISPDVYNFILSSNTLEGKSINDLSFKAIPTILAKIIEKIFSIDWVVGIALVDKEELFGAIGFVGTKGTVAYSVKDLEAFADISKIAIQRWLVDQKQRQDELKYNIIAQNTTDLIWIMGMDFKYQFISPAVEKIRGFSVEEASKLDMKEILLPHSYQLVMLHFHNEIEKEKQGGHDPNRTLILELEEYHKDGHTIWVETKVSFLRDSFLNPIAIIGVSRDITDRRKKDKDIAQKNAILNSLLENLPFDFWVRDTESKLILFNKPSADKWGYRLGTLPDDSPGIDENTLNIWKSNNERVLSGEIIKEELIIGNQTYYQVISPIYSENEIIGFGGVNIDISNLKEIEKKIRDSEARLKYAEIVAGFGHWEFHLDSGEVIASDGTRMIFGFGREPLTIQDIMSPILPQYKTQIQEILKNIDNVEENAVLEFKIRRKNDDQIRIVKSIFAKKNNYIFSGVVQDISETKKAQAALELSEERYRQIVENLTISVVIHQNNKIVYANQAAMFMIGAESKDQLMGKNVVDFVYFEDRAAVVQLIQTALHTNLSTVASSGNIIEERIMRFDGSIIIIEASAIMIDYQGSPALMVLLNDITARKDAEIALKNSEEKFRSLAESTQDIIIRYDSELKIKYMNSSGLMFFKLEIEDFIGKTNSELGLFDFSQTVFWESQIQQVIDNATPHRVQFELTFKNHFTYLDWYLSPEFDLDGKVRSVMCISRDMTEMRLIQVELEKSKKKAEEADHLKSAFLANMSHEIRTPMNGIIGFSGLLEKNDISIEEKKEYAVALNQSAHRLLDLVNNIIDLSKIETNQMEVYESVFNINSLMFEIFEEFKSTAEKQKIEFTLKTDLKNDYALMLGDETKIAQVLRLLLSNAFKFTSEGQINFGYHIFGTKIHFFIKDTGTGISKEFMPRIFERFSQEDNSFNRNYEGSGLGLCIAKGLVELLGGSIGVESEKGKYSNFHFKLQYKTSSNSLPYNENIDEPTTDYVIENETEQDRTIKIIIAEDDHISYLLLNNLLMREGKYNVLYAANGEEAVKLSQEHKDISLVFMDIKMPIMDGLTATRLIRRIHQELPIIAVTALAMIGDREKAIRAGCSDYITKPFNTKEIISLLKKYELY